MADWTWTDDEIAAITAQAHAAETTDAPTAVAARYDPSSGRIIVDLDNETTFIFPASRAEGLAGADPDLLAQVEITPNGDGLHWEALDADLGLQGLLMGRFGSETWMRRLQAERERHGGPTRAKTAKPTDKAVGRPKKSQQA